jgi:subtilase family serine protease
MLVCSANGAQFRAYTNGTDFHYYGTSLAAPLWASVITLLNEERTAAGKGPVGFINPVLYDSKLPPPSALSHCQVGGQTLAGVCCTCALILLRR